MAGDGLDVDRVVARPAVEVGRAGVRRLDGEGVVAAAELDVQGLEVVVLDAARQLAAGDHGVAAHAEAGQVIGGQVADVVGRAVAVEDVHDVDLLRLVDAEVQVDRAVEVAVSGLGLLQLLDLEHGEGADRRDCRLGAEAAALAVDDHQQPALAGGDEALRRALVDRIGQRRGDLGQALALLHDMAQRAARLAVVDHHGPDFARDRRAGQLDLGRHGGFVHHRLVVHREFCGQAMDDQQRGALGGGREQQVGIGVDIRRQALGDVFQGIEAAGIADRVAVQRVGALDLEDQVPGIERADVAVQRDLSGEGGCLVDIAPGGDDDFACAGPADIAGHGEHAIVATGDQNARAKRSGGVAVQRLNRRGQLNRHLDIGVRRAVGCIDRFGDADTDPVEGQRQGPGLSGDRGAAQGHQRLRVDLDGQRDSAAAVMADHHQRRVVHHRRQAGGAAVLVHRRGERRRQRGQAVPCPDGEIVVVRADGQAPQVADCDAADQLDLGGLHFDAGAIGAHHDRLGHFRRRGLRRGGRHQRRRAAEVTALLDDDELVDCAGRDVGAATAGVDVEGQPGGHGGQVLGAVDDIEVLGVVQRDGPGLAVDRDAVQVDGHGHRLAADDLGQAVGVAAGGRHAQRRADGGSGRAGQHQHIALGDGLQGQCALVDLAGELGGDFCQAVALEQLIRE